MAGSRQGLLSRLVRSVRRGLIVGRQAAVDLLLPPRCAYCAGDLPEDTQWPQVCADCLELLAPQYWPHCQRCGGAVQTAVPDCWWCRKHDLQFDAVIPLGEYANDLRRAVLRLKRVSGTTLAVAMADLLAARRGEELRQFSPTLVAAVPMFWMRRLLRGVNNPQIVARQLARRLAVPYAERLLCRSRNTLTQKDLKPEERFRNVRAAFAVRKGYDLQGARVLLVDDILTTGATCSVLAQVLKGAGVDRVAVAVLARAEGHHPA